MEVPKKSFMKRLLEATIISISIAFFIFIVLFSIKLALDLDINAQSRDNPQKIKLFNENVSMICGTSKDRFSNAHIVSKDDNWSVYGKYFKKVFFLTET